MIRSNDFSQGCVLSKSRINFMPLRTGNIEELTKSKKGFLDYAEQINKIYRSGDDLRFYRKIINSHRQYNNLEKILNIEGLYQLLWDTLDKWNMNQRAAKLTTLGKLRKSILKNKRDLIKLHKYKTESLSVEKYEKEVKDLLKKVFLDLKVTENKSHIVAVSKTLHFLLPDLIMPMDRRYVMNFFYGHNNYKTGVDEFNVFDEVLREGIKIAEKLNLSNRDVKDNGKNWNTSVPKLIDNAVIVFMKSREDKDSGHYKSKKLIKLIEVYQLENGQISIKVISPRNKNRQGGGFLVE